MEIKLKAEIPEDMTYRERRAMLESLLDEMSIHTVAQEILDICGPRIVDCMQQRLATDQESTSE